MMQELIGSGGGISGGERRSIPFNGAHHVSHSPSSSPSPTNSSSSTALATNSTTTATKSASSPAEHLRCPRCDSSNTKFCYYNNYNLTQPRHFCKTCRRYWTKGGALRNVPIGGGCRKNRAPSGMTPSSGAKSTSNNKIKTMACDVGRSGFGSGFDHIYELPSNPIMWATPHQNGSHLLSLFRDGAAQNPNPSLILSGTSLKEEGGFMGAQILTDPTLGFPGGALGTTGRGQGLDQLGQVPNPMWRTNQQQNGEAMADDQNSAFQQLYQRLRSSTGYYTDTSLLPMVLGNAASSSSALALDSSSIVGGDNHIGFWNPSCSWSDLPTAANGAYRN